MRLLRTLAPLALIALVATACGSGSSSDSASPGDGSATTTSNQFEVRPVFARYSPGPQFGPPVPKELQDQMSHQACPMKPATVQGMLMECDADKTVYLMKAPITTGGVTAAVAKQVGGEQDWAVDVTLDPTTMEQLKTGTAGLTGTDIAYSFQGKVLTSVIVDSSFGTGKLAILGTYDKASATRLADEISKS